MGAAVQRQNAFAAEAEELPDLDLGEFKPTPRAARPKVDKAATRAAAERSGFTSREPSTPASAAAPAQPDPAPRRGRLQRPEPVRKEQFNLRASVDSIERFAAIARDRKWLLTDTFDEAVKALEEKLASRS